MRVLIVLFLIVAGVYGFYAYTIQGYSKASFAKTCADQAVPIVAASGNELNVDGLCNCLSDKVVAELTVEETLENWQKKASGVEIEMMIPAKMGVEMLDQCKSEGLPKY